MRVAITFKHAAAWREFISSPKSSSKALSLLVIKPCIKKITDKKDHDNNHILLSEETYCISFDHFIKIPQQPTLLPGLTLQ